MTPTDAEIATQDQAPSDQAALDARIVAILRGGAADWTGLDDEPAAEAFLGRADVHGVAAMLGHAVAGQPEVPKRIAEALRMCAIRSFGWDAEHRNLAGRLIEALAAEGVPALVIKGTALACTHYGDPALRQRGDSDVLIAARNRDAAHRVLAALGYRQVVAADSAETVGETTHYIDGVAAPRHFIDLHWDATNTSFLTGLFDFEELMARSVALPGLPPAARGAGPVDALMIACIHRQKHLQAPYYVHGVAHFDADRLIWLKDIDLLARTLAPEEVDELVAEAGARALIEVCHDGFVSAAATFGTPMPKALADAHAALHRQEAPSRYLQASRIGRDWMNFASRKGTAAKLRHLRALFFPPATYMRLRYPDRADHPLPYLYARRAVLGLAKRLTGRL